MGNEQYNYRFNLHPDLNKETNKVLNYELFGSPGFKIIENGFFGKKIIESYKGDRLEVISPLLGTDKTIIDSNGKKKIISKSWIFARQKYIKDEDGNVLYKISPSFWFNNKTIITDKDENESKIYDSFWKGYKIYENSNGYKKYFKKDFFGNTSIEDDNGVIEVINKDIWGKEDQEEANKDEN